MKTYQQISSSLLILCAFSHQAAFADWGDNVKGSGKVETEERNVESFSEIRSSGSIDVYITLGSEQSIQVIADDNLLDLIETEVNDGRLDVSNNGSFSRVTKMEVHITAESLEEIVARGSTDITVLSEIEASDFELKAHGSSNITFKDPLVCETLDVALIGSSDAELEVTATEITGKLVGSSDLEISGTADRLEISLAGSSDLEAFDLKVGNAKVKASGSSDAYLSVSEDLEARASGSSDIIYKGEPKTTNLRTGGSADIIKRGS